MSTFNINALTVQGMVAIAALVAGGTLEFTRIAVGDGELKDGQVPGTMTKLNNPLFDVTINKVYSDSVSQATIQGVFSNSQVATGFYYRELGLFAKDPATGSEILYAYGNAGADAEWITPAGESSIIEKEIHIVVLIGNATNVTATLNSGIYAIKKETEAALALKADLDNTAEEGGRVLATQMRFDADQTLYVDAAAAEGGDGSQAKPFKTIQAAINSRYKGAPVIYIRIKAGTYTENISVPRSPGTTWRFIREGTGTVAINTALIDNCTYTVFDNLTFNGPATDNSTIIYVANTASANLNAVTVNGASNATGINFSTSRGIIRNSVFNNCGLAIAATDGAYLDLKGNSGTGNIRALQADGSIIISDWYIPQATTPYEKVNGGVINLEGGTSSFPSNYSQMYSLGDFTDAGTLKTAILTEFRKLGIGESRDCWFANNISAGFGPFGSGQRMQCKIIKSTDSGSGYGTIIFYSHHNAPAGFMQVQDGAFATAAPVKFITGSDIATYDNYGLVRVADDTDVLSDDNDEAAITPAVYHDVSDFRHKSTAYKVGDKVECMFNFELFLECTQGGTTGSGALDTRNVTHGQVITDGTVKWTVRTHIKSVNNIVADASGNVSINTVTNATKAAQDSDGNAINTTYLKRSGGTVEGDLTINSTKYTRRIRTGDSGVGLYFGEGGKHVGIYDWSRNAEILTYDADTNILKASKIITGNITGNAGTSTKATQDSDGKQINTTYLKRNQTTQNDMNACTVEGIYRFNGSLSNAWTSQAWGTLLVFNNHFNGASGVNDTFLVQLAFPTDGKIWTRQRVNTGAWSSWLKVAHITDNVASATKATQDKNGRDITGYLYKTEDLVLNSSSNVITSGNITEILNAFCTKFKNIQGTDTYAENPPTNIKSLNDNKVSTSGDTLGGTYARSGDHIRIKNVDRNTNTGAGLIVADNYVGLYDWSLAKDIIKAENGKGYAVVQTPATSDNSTRIANTAFVQSLINSKGTIIASSLGTNGYVKFSNGFIVQWGKVSLTNSNWEGEVGPFNFPISFTNNCFLVLPSLGNNDGTNPKSYDTTVQQRRWNKSQFWLYQQDMGGNPWFSFANYIAIGN